MIRKLFVVAVFAGVLLPGRPMASPAQQSFRARTNVVRVDVIVRDRDGNVVRGLTAADFVVTEDGKVQQVSAFDFEEITTQALPAASVPAVLGLDTLQGALQRTATTTPTTTTAPEAS